MSPSEAYLDSKVHGANMRPIWDRQDPGWPHVGPMNLAIWHDDVIKWKHFPRYWPFVRRIRRSPVNSPHKGQWRGALMFSLISVWINDWVNNGEAGDLRRYRIHYDVPVMGIAVSEHQMLILVNTIPVKTYSQLSLRVRHYSGKVK